MGKRFIISEEEMIRYEVLNEVVSGRISLKGAKDLLGISYRQAIRLKKRFINEGLEGLLRRKPQNPPNLNLTPELKDEIIRLRESLYWDFNILHFQESLKERHGISLSYESIRKILIREGLHEPNKRRKIYRRRRRMPRAGMLVQMDSSQHRWIESISEPWWLVTMIDDADGFVYAEFHPSETVWANMKVIRAYIEQRGVFMALYTDKASHFRTTRHGGLRYHVEVEQKETQIQRALGEFGIKLINANSPQAKGRIERKFRFFQDRLIKEMRLRGIKNYEEANRFLREEFLPWCNRRYTYQVESLYRPLPEDKDLNLIFSIRHPRKVNKDNTVRFQGRFYQLLPMKGIRSFAGKWIEVSKKQDGGIELLYEGKIIPYVETVDKGMLEIKREDEELINLRINAKTLVKEIPKQTRRPKSPSLNHPWRMVWKKKNVTFQSSNKV